MEYNIHGLQCDHPTCDYRDDSIQLEEYEAYIDYPCPLCDSPLLTQADYDTTMNIIKMMEEAEKLAVSMGLPTNETDEEQYKISVTLDGTGVPIFDAQKIK